MTASIDFGDPLRAALRCEKLETQGVEKRTCTTFKDTLEVSRNSGMEVVQQGVLPTLNILTTFFDESKGFGNVYESTKDGATVSKIIIGFMKYTENGKRLISARP